jgi:hypothetical protein
LDADVDMDVEEAWGRDMQRSVFRAKPVRVISKR